MLKVFGGMMAALLLAGLVALLLGHYDTTLLRVQRGGDSTNAGSSSLSPSPGPLPDNIFWFVQVSDLHISRFLDPTRAPDFEKFCSETISVIKPDLVLVTGDLTDAKTRNKVGSRQYEVEWQTYQGILKRSRVLEKTKWIDIRGNHDAFNILSLDSVSNYYRKYSAFRKEGHFHYIHRTHFGSYSFICVDATLTPGPKRPYNFYGILNQTGVTELAALAEESHHSNQSIWFGHYTTSTIISAAPGIRQVMSSATAYLCGHLHTLGGLMPVLHSQHRQGTLELELGDWMINRRYRIAAFDHDLFSFSDLSFDVWPAVLITNPKATLYSNPAQEPLGRIRNSTHIRILAFSTSSISSVLVSIDGIDLGNAVSTSGPLFVLKWDPMSYSKGLHYIYVKVQDDTGRTVSKEHVFTLEDDVPLRFNLLPSFILLTDHYILVRIIFFLSIAVHVSIIIVFRYLKKPVPKEPPGLLTSACLSLHAFSKSNNFYYPILLFSLYTVVGPWFVGELIDGHVGVCFTFGLIVNGHFLEGSLTYLVGTMQVVCFNFPLNCYLCWCLSLRCRGHCFRAHVRDIGVLRTVPVHLIMLLCFIWQSYSCVFLLQTYGVLAFFISPQRTWSLILTVILIRKTWTSTDSHLRTYIAEMKNYHAS